MAAVMCHLVAHQEKLTIFVVAFSAIYTFIVLDMKQAMLQHSTASVFIHQCSWILVRTS